MRRRRNQPDARRRVPHLRDPRIHFHAGQLPALTGLRALGHLDLQFLRVDEVVARHAETPGRDLFDRRVLRVAVRLAHVTRRIFAALARVAAAAETIHRDGERLVRLFRDRAVTHCARLEPLHDRFDGFDFLDGNRAGRLKIQQPAQRTPRLVLVVDQRGIFLERLVIRGADGLLQFVNRLWIEEVILALFAPLILAADVERVAVDLPFGERVPMPNLDLARDHIHAHALDAAGGPGEIFIDHRTRETDGLKNLRAAIRLNRRDAHFRGDFHDTLHRGLRKIFARGLVFHADEQALTNHVVERLERQIRIDRAAAVSDQQREMMHLARLARFEHQADARPRALANEMVMQPAHREQRWNRGVLRVDAAVGQNENVDAVGDGLVGLLENIVERFLEALRALRHRIQNRQRDGFVAGLVEMLELGKFLVRENRRLEFDEVTALGNRVEQIFFRANRGLRAGDNFLANAINRRVRDLREELLEIIEQRLRLVRQHRQRRVRAHRADRLHAVARHRHHEQAQILERVPKRLLPLEHRVVIRFGQLAGVRQRRQFDHVLVEPLSIRMRLRDGALDFLVRDDAPLLGVHEEHPARLQAALFQNVFRRKFQHARLARHHDQIIFRDVIPARPQPIPVKRRTDDFAVSERNGRGAVPRFHQARVKFVERLFLVAHGLVIRPRLRDHHHQRVRQRAAREHEQFEAVVEHRRVAPIGINHRQRALNVLAEKIALEERLPRVHPVDVAAQRVDLAVVRDVAIRMRARPTGKCVCAEPRVNQRQRRFHRFVLQIGEILPHLHGEQHPFVNHRLEGKAAHVPVGRAINRRATNLVVGALANHVQLPLECQVVGDRRVAPDDGLPDVRLRGFRRFAERAIHRRHRAPAEEMLPFGLHDLLELLLQFPALLRIGRQKK